MALTGKGWFGVQVTHGEELGLEKPERRQKDGVRKIFCVHFQQIFFIFFTFICLQQPSLTFIDLHWNGSKKGVFGRIRRVGGGEIDGT